LTETGEEQAQLLGTWWRARGVRFDEVRCGLLQRQRQTAQLCLPDQPRIVDSRWNEYDATGVLQHLRPLLAEQDAGFAVLSAKFDQMRGTGEVNKHFQAMFEPLMNWWSSGAVTHPQVEPFADFERRVRDVLFETLSSGSRDVLVVCSGGVIGACVQTVLDAPPAAALRLNWRIRNCSLTEFVFTKGKVSLDLYNSVAHLPADLVTYR
jgi:broad specificity phosphatase PhoE